MAEKKEESSKNAEQKELEERYKKLFNNVVKTIGDEHNAMIVYQVLCDILSQLEAKIRSQMKDEHCDHDCKECGGHK